jgi:hypothetical protein
MRPNPGSPRKDFFNKKFYDEQTRAVTHPVNAPRATLNPGNVIIEAMLPEDSTIESISPYRPVVLGVGNFITPGSDLLHLSSTAFKCYAHTENNSYTKFNPTWGISLDFITKSSPGKVQLTGGCWLQTSDQVEIPSGDSFDVFNSKLWRCYGGKADIVADSDTQWYYVSLTKSTMTWIGKTTSDGLTPGTPGLVNIYEYHDDGYRSTGITKTCITVVSPIVGIKDVEVSIKGGMLLALEIC